MRLSVLIPVHDEKENLAPLWEQLAAKLGGIPDDWEVIFVNDGSTDGSALILDDLAAADTRIRIIHLKRNYGQTAALMAAIEVSQGDILIPMDGDLQNDPADIPRLLEQIDIGYDVVSGWRKFRQDKAITRRLPSFLANRLISLLMGVNLHDYGCTLKAYRRDVIMDIRLYGEMHRFIPIYATWEGAKVIEIPVTHHPRRAGRSKYGLGRVIRVVLDLVVIVFIDRAFDRPIQFFGKIGLLAMAASILTFLLAVYLKYFAATTLIQTPLPLLATALALSGILFVMIGLLAEVQVRTYFESQNKRPYAIRSTRNLPTDR